MPSSTPHGRTIVIHNPAGPLADMSVQVRGVDFETRRLSVLALNERAVVIKVPGRSVWNGNFSPRRYVSPEIMVYRILKQVDKPSKHPNVPHALVLDVEPLIEWSTVKNPKE